MKSNKAYSIVVIDSDKLRASNVARKSFLRGVGSGMDVFGAGVQYSVSLYPLSVGGGLRGDVARLANDARRVKQDGSRAKRRIDAVIARARG